MTMLTLELPSELYEQLRAEADRQGRPLEGVAEAWLAERLALSLSSSPATTQPTQDAREQVCGILRARGLLIEPTPEELAWAETSDVTLEEVSAALDRSGGKPLSEIILEQRGPKG